MEIEKAFKRLLIKKPFYGLFCLSLPKVITRDVATMCVTKKGVNCQLNINPDFWQRYTDDEQIALLMHELGHICFQHMFISDSFADQKNFNVAADAEVNSYIENLPKDGITPKWLSQKLGKQLDNGLGTKKYYEAIQDYLNRQQQQQQAQSQSQSDSQQQPPSTQEDEQQPENQQEQQERPQDEEHDSNEQPQGETPEQQSQYPKLFEDELGQFDDHSTWKDFKDIPEATQQLMQNNINAVLKQTAEEVEKMRGTIPGEFTELIAKLKEKKPEVFNWKAYFRRLLGSIYDVNIRSTRRKPSKRFEGSAGIQHKKKVSILVAIDTSGSVSQKELQEFFSEIDYVYKAGARVTILQCDTRINSIEEYDGKNLPTIKGRGGTSFDPPVDYYHKHRKDYATLIYFTDGEAPMPAKNPSGMVWVISSMGYHQDYPGKVIYIPEENN